MSPDAREDVLGHGFLQETIELGSDHEGAIVATLVRRDTGTSTNVNTSTGVPRRAVLYVHGYNDYFFQRELADRYNAAGFDFYALDLRKYGRSLRDGQTPAYTDNLVDYYAELDAAVERIRKRDGHDTLVVVGHSTGGLIASLYAHDRGGRAEITALVLNSPFLDFLGRWWQELALEQLIARFGELMPRTVVRKEGKPYYAWSLHRSFGRGGEWDYNLEWKRERSLPMQAGWVAAIRDGHRRVQCGLHIPCPVLTMYSDRSGGGEWSDAYFESDVVLDVADIDRFSGKLGADVTEVRVAGGMHDLFLSRAPVRERAYTAMFEWLAARLPAAPGGAQAPP